MLWQRNVEVRKEEEVKECNLIKIHLIWQRKQGEGESLTLL